VTSRYALYNRLKQRISPTLLFNQTLYENVLRSHVSDKTIWLDAGCGHKLLPSWRADAECALIQGVGFACGCDGDASAIREHRSLTRRVVCDLTALPFKPETFTLITCNMVAEHLDDPLRVFREFSRILKPTDGTVIIHTPHRWSYFAVISALIPQFIKNRIGAMLDTRQEQDYYPVRYRCNTINRLRSLFQAAGMEQVKASMYASDAVFQFLADTRIGRVLLRMELYLLRLSLKSSWRFLRLTICGIYKKPLA
jgi:SAM-dependent methyltransferase